MSKVASDRSVKLENRKARFWSRLDPGFHKVYTQDNRRPRRSGSRGWIVGVILFSLGVGFLVTACSNPPNSSPAIETVTPSLPSIVPTDLPHPTTSPTTPAQPIPTNTPIDCLHKPGTLEIHELQHPEFVSPVRLQAYIPPCYQQDSFASYPVLILLHGLLATDSQWVDLGVTEMADKLIQSGDSPPFIILLPWIRNSQDPVLAVMEAIVPFAMEQWRVSDQRKFWAIGGLSRGGGQALQIALLYPEQFSAIGLHSPATLHTPETLANWYLAIENTKQPQIWLDMGSSDSLMQSALALLDVFEEAQIPVIQRFSEGDHTTSYWMRNLPRYLSWYRSFWIPSP